ncbi:MAG: thiamine phosphate synthase [Thermacetogeniaceae bacterium]
MAIDYALYLVTDRDILGDRDLLKAVEQALQGGVTMLQLREKTASSRDFYQLAVRMKELAAAYQVPLIINDRLDIALAADADGLHVGQEDLPVAMARRILGPGKILGYSVSTVAEAVYGEQNGADYLGAGPVYATGSKADAGSPIGVVGLRQIKESVAIPVVGIGGIGEANILDVKRAGVDGASVISAIMGSRDLERAASALIAAWRQP